MFPQLSINFHVAESCRFKLLINHFASFRLQPASEDEKSAYYKFYDYLTTRERFGVIDSKNAVMVKDCYVLPLAKDQEVHK